MEKIIFTLEGNTVNPTAKVWKPAICYLICQRLKETETTFDSFLVSKSLRPLLI